VGLSVFLDGFGVWYLLFVFGQARGARTAMLNKNATVNTIHLTKESKVKI
jgi:hypothetical protein